MWGQNLMLPFQLQSEDWWIQVKEWRTCFNCFSSFSFSIWQAFIYRQNKGICLSKESTWFILKLLLTQLSRSAQKPQEWSTDTAVMPLKTVTFWIFQTRVDSILKTQVKSGKWNHFKLLFQFVETTVILSFRLIFWYTDINVEKKEEIGRDRGRKR